jgi:hypothetical protein
VGAGCRAAPTNGDADNHVDAHAYTFVYTDGLAHSHRQPNRHGYSLRYADGLAHGDPHRHPASDGHTCANPAIPADRHGYSLRYADIAAGNYAYCYDAAIR